jgi:cleavage and polyadenylation specificity factor subunit 1
MQAYTELLPPTAVTHALSLPFTSRKAQNLIVVKTSLLQIFRVKRLQDATSITSNGVDHPSSPTLTRNATNDVPTKRARSRLVLIGEYALSGTVTSVAAIKAMETRSGGHALLVSFMDAKISLVQWDPEIYSISTISIHYYENEALQGAPWAPELGQCDSYLTVDPSNRCAAFKFGQRHLAILPFRQPGDDFAMGEYDPDAEKARTTSSVKANGETKQQETPYASSFVLPLTALDSNLIHPIDLAFLHEYREPTLGVLASAKAPAMSLIQERKDPLTYTVFTLDLEQRARTPLLSVSGLPADLFKMVPLPDPIGGTLLIGGNELIHIDQSGKTTAISVNDFARECSSFPMTDQADLKMRLEHCVFAQIDESKGAMLLILDSGEFAILSFSLDGRSVNGLSVQRISPEQGGDLSRNGATCTAALGGDLLFVGGQDCDALLLSYDRTDGLDLTRKRSHAEMLGIDDVDVDEEEDLEDDDDLYGNDTVTTKAVTSSSHANGTLSGGNIQVHVEDRLLNLSATGPPTFSPSSIRQSVSEHMAPGLDLAIPTGSGSAGSIAFATKTMKLDVVSTLGIAGIRDAWSLSMSSEIHSAGFDNVLLVSHVTEDGVERSSVHEFGQDDQIKARTGTDFEGSIVTLNAGVLHKAMRLVQVSHSEIRCYDSSK